MEKFYQNLSDVAMEIFLEYLEEGLDKETAKARFSALLDGLDKEYLTALDRLVK